MAIHITVSKRVFQFSFKARTSRGLMKDKTSWFVVIRDTNIPDVFGIGECGPLPGLSPDAGPDVEDVLRDVVRSVAKFSRIDQVAFDKVKEIVPPDFPSVVFGLETAILDFVNGGTRRIFNNSFADGAPIAINGLIWMGDMDFMMNQINTKIAEGFRCIKLKVGGLDFDRECDTLQYIRKRYFRDDITIRLDANGAFKAEDVLFRLDQLVKYNIQSIEQPIKAGKEEMEELCRKSPVPIAFDEELIGKESLEEKSTLLNRLRPQFIVLKPTLHGGISGCREWIRIAEALGIGWWMTSALESNIGLNAICQLTAEYPVTIPQGLGTGKIYQNNIASPLDSGAGIVRYHADRAWDFEDLLLES